MLKQRIFSIVFLSIFLSFSSVQSQVVLTEIMFDASGSENHDEFIEIFNLSESESVNLAGWQISDGNGIDNIIEVDEGVLLKPGQFAIILDQSYFDNSDIYNELIPESALILTIDNLTFGSGGLSNSSPETISLINSNDDIVSEYTYSTGNEPGKSDEKIILSGPNSLENWADSQVFPGTPGSPNSVTPLKYDLAVLPGDLNFTPEKLEAGDSATLQATIRNFGLLPANDFYVTFFEALDGDSLIETDDMLAAPFEFEGELLKGDSTSFTIVYNNLLPDRHLMVVKVDFELDEDTTNNVIYKELLVGYSEKSVVINEIMYSPLTNQAEWIEIYNRSSYAINLNHWSISDSEQNSRGYVEDNVVLPSNSYFVFAEDSSISNFIKPPPGSFIVLKNWSALNNNFDSVVLYDLTGVAIDRVNYNQDWGGSSGISLEKINPELASNDSSNWSSAVVYEGGTPSEQNSIFTDILPSEAAITVSPNPFSPDGDSVDDFTVISYKLPVNTAAVNLKIFDLRGRLIRFLANNQPSGSQNAIIWNGRDDQNQIVRMGIYIVFMQALNAQTGILKTEKKTVVLARKL